MGRPLEGNLPRRMAWAHASGNWAEPRSDAGRSSRTQPLRAGIRLRSPPAGARAGSVPGTGRWASADRSQALETELLGPGFGRKGGGSAPRQTKLEVGNGSCRFPGSACFAGSKCLVRGRPGRQRLGTSRSLQAEGIAVKNSSRFPPENRSSV